MKSTLRVLVSLAAAVITYFAALLASFPLIPSGAGLWRPLIVLTFVGLVTSYLWRQSASPPQLLVSASVVGVLVAAVPGWGYWAVLSHGDLRVSILDIALRDDQQLYGRVRTGEVTFRNATGGVLAHGGADSRMLHPEVGDCRREEGEGETAWQVCFDAQSHWFVTWVPQVHHATIRLDTCTIDALPVLVEKSRERWWLWWVPHPHLDNSTRTHFELTVWIDTASCTPADRSRVGSALIFDLVLPLTKGKSIDGRLAPAQPNKRLQPTAASAIMSRRG